MIVLGKLAWTSRALTIYWQHAQLHRTVTCFENGWSCESINEKVAAIGHGHLVWPNTFELIPVQANGLISSLAYGWFDGVFHPAGRCRTASIGRNWVVGQTTAGSPFKANPRRSGTEKCSIVVRDQLSIGHVASSIDDWCVIETLRGQEIRRHCGH